MVAGYSGLGKTSFIRTLFGTLKLRSGPGSLRNKASVAQLAGNSSGTSTPTTDISAEKRPTSPSATSAVSGGLGTKANGTKDSVGYATGELERTLNSFEALFEIEESAEKINLTLVDTPGFLGSDEVVDAHCDEIIAYLEYQFDLTLAEVRTEKKGDRAPSFLFFFFFVLKEGCGMDSVAVHAICFYRSLWPFFHLLSNGVVCPV